MRNFITALPLAATLLLLPGCNQSSFSTYPVTTAASASLSTTAVAFGASPVGMTSNTQSITLIDNGSANLVFENVSVSGPNASAFLATSNCPTTVLKNSSCTISVAFAPSAATAQTATLAVNDTALGSPQTVTLTGTGTASGPIAAFSATAVSFSTLPVGQASTQTITLSNIGNGSLALYGFTLGGTNATSFALSGSCLTTASLAASSSCYLTITYAPTVSGSLTAIVNANDSAPNSPQTIALSTK